MPRPLSWFENQVDPLLPQTIKPLLYMFDEYQTYDLIVYNKCTYTFTEISVPFLDIVLYNNLNNAALPLGIFNFARILIERFTPWNYAWCENYSTKLFNFIYRFTGTDYYDDPDITFRGNDDSVSFQPVNSGGGFSLLSQYVKPQIGFVNLRLPKTEIAEVVAITWLERDENYIVHKEYCKRYILLNTSANKEIVSKFDYTKVIYGSVVVSGSNESVALSIEQQIPIGCLYSSLDQMLLLIEKAYTDAYPRLFLVGESFDYLVKRTVEAGVPTTASVGFGSFIPYIRNQAPPGEFYRPVTITHSNHVYRERPDYYRSASLLYANNNYWNNSSPDEPIFSDLGKTPYFYKDESDRLVCHLLPPHYEDLYSNKGYPQNSNGYHIVYVLPNTFPVNDGQPGFFSPFAINDYNVFLAGFPYSVFTNNNSPKAFWQSSYEPSNINGTASLLRSRSGNKYTNIAIVSTLQLTDPNAFSSPARETGHYIHYKFDYRLINHPDGSFTQDTGNFNQYAESDYNGIFLHPDNVSYYHEDEITYTGTIKLNYFLSDTGWQHEIIDNVLLSNAQVISLIDEYLYRQIVENPGEFEVELNA